MARKAGIWVKLLICKYLQNTLAKIFFRLSPVWKLVITYQALHETSSHDTEAGGKTDTKIRADKTGSERQE